MNEALPGWLAALRADAGLAGELGITWLDDELRRTLYHGAMALLAEPGGDERWAKRGLERMERCVPLAMGPERRKRLSQAETSTAIFFDPARPDHVCLSLAASMCPLVWAEAPATPEGLRALFARTFVTELQPWASLPRRHRSVASFGEGPRERIEQAIASGHPMIDDASWYSGHDDDPWTGVGPLGALRLAAFLRNAQRENQNRLPSVSFRSLFSRSVITVEQHPFGLWVVDVRYAPSEDAAAVRWVNEIFRSRFPEDMPVDVVGSNLMNGGHTFLGELEEQGARGEIDDFAMVARLALAPGEPESTALLRGWVARFADDPQKLAFLATLAARYTDDGTPLAIAAACPGSELEGQILAQLAFKERADESGEATDDDEEEEDDGEEDDEEEDA